MDPHTDDQPSRAGSPSLVLSLAGTIWLAAMTAWYLWTAVTGLRHPLNEGADLTWAVAISAVAVVVALSHLLIRNRPITAAWLALEAAVAATMAVRSGNLFEAAAVVWLLALGWVWTRWILRALGATPPESLVEACAVVQPLSLAVLTLVPLALGVSGRLTPAWIGATLVVASAARWRELARIPRDVARVVLAIAAVDRAPRLPIEARVLLVFIGMVGLMNLAWALSPEVQFDALSYHLAVPQTYLAAHRFVDLPDFWQSYRTQLIDLVFAIALALGGPIAAKLLIFATGVAAALGAYALGRHMGGGRVAIWSAALFYTTPIAAWLSTTCYTDMIVAALWLATVLGFLRWRQTRQPGWLIVAALLAGAAVGAKVTAALGVPILAALGAIDLVAERRLSRQARVKLAMGCLLAAAVFSVPWYAVRGALTGNPFFPLFENIISSERALPFEVTPALMVGSYKRWTSDVLGQALLPFDLTFRTKLTAHYRDGAVGCALVLLPLVVVWWRRGSSAARTVLVVTVGFLCLWARYFPNPRIYTAALPLVTVLAVYGVSSTVPTRWGWGIGRGLLGSLVLAQAVLIPGQFWAIPDRIPLSRALGHESSEAFLSRAIPDYAAVQYLNRTVAPGDKVVSYQTEFVRFYLHPPLATPGETWRLYDLAVGDHRTIASGLAARGYVWLLLAERQLSTAFRRAEYLRRSFVDGYGELKFSRNGVNVYRLSDKPVVRRSTVNLLRNAGFEMFDTAGSLVGWGRYGQPGLSRSESIAHTGSGAVSAGKEHGWTQIVPIQGGRLYTLGHFSRAERSGQAARLQINWLDGDGGQIDVTIRVVPAHSTWKSHYMSVTALPGARRAEVYVSVHENGQAWFDDFWFGEGPPPPP